MAQQAQKTTSQAPAVLCAGCCCRLFRPLITGFYPQCLFKLIPFVVLSRQQGLLNSYGNITGVGQQTRQQQQEAASAADQGSNSSSALDDSLQQHFTSIQELSDKQALEELLPRLHDVVMRVRTVHCCIMLPYWIAILKHRIM